MLYYTYNRITFLFRRILLHWVLVACIRAYKRTSRIMQIGQFAHARTVDHVSYVQSTLKIILQAFCVQSPAGTNGNSNIALISLVYYWHKCCYVNGRVAIGKGLLSNLFDERNLLIDSTNIFDEASFPAPYLIVSFNSSLYTVPYLKQTNKKKKKKKREKKFRNDT